MNYRSRLKPNTKTKLFISVVQTNEVKTNLQIHKEKRKNEPARKESEPRQKVAKGR